jgi:hypothetical protein
MTNDHRDGQAMKRSRALSQDWQFTQIGGGQGTKNGEWLPVSQFPTSVHVELLGLGRIPDPVRIPTRYSGSKGYLIMI